MIIACSPDVAAVRRRDGWIGGRDRFFVMVDKCVLGYSSTGPQRTIKQTKH